MKIMIFINKRNQIIGTIVLWILIWYIMYKQDFLLWEQMYIYAWLWILTTTFLFFKNKYIKLFSLPWLLGLWFLLLLGFLPLYKDAPDVSLFYQTQALEYIFNGNPNNVEIKDIGDFWEQKITPIENNQKIFLLENNKRTIFFDEKIISPQEKNTLIIVFPDNTIYITYPWSEITIEKINNTYKLTKKYWKAEYYQPDDNRQTTIQTDNNEEKKNKSDFSVWYIIENYEKNKIKYIIEQAGGGIIMQPLYQRFSKNILEIAIKIRPKIYQKNLENYQKYKEILKRNEQEKNYEKVEKWREPIILQIQKWQKETRVLQ